MVRFVLDDDKVYKVVAESDDAIWVIDYDNPCAPKNYDVSKAGSG